MSKLKTAQERLTKGKVGLLFHYPFFGSISLGLDLVDGSAMGIETAATDGRKIYYNEEYVMGLNEREITFLVAHEVLHVVFAHMLRRNDRDGKIWNYAADYVINDQLVEGNVGQPIEGVLLDDQYKGMFSEQVYQLIMDEVKQKQNDDGQGQGQGNPGGGDANGQGEGVPGSGSGSGHGGMSPSDCHITFDPITGEATIITKSGKVIKTEDIQPMSGEESDKLGEDIQGRIITASKGAGAGMSAGLKRYVDDLVDPKIDWRSYLCNEISHQVRDDFSFSIPSRKSRGQMFVLPGVTHGEHVEVTLALDTSGSISHEMIKEFLSEIEGIVQQYESYKMTVFCFDTSIHAVEHYSNENPFEWDDYEPGGGGGTMFECIFEYLKEEALTPTKQLVVLTDGYPCGSWGDEDFCPTVFLINGDTSRSITAPFGTTVHYED